MGVPIFPDAEEMNGGTLFFMLLVYGFVLFKASKTISEGSEMLLILFGPGIIGGLIIPILGALPDCMIILLSGLKSSGAELEEEIRVGVGTLVGSTVMLITIPWALGVFLGRRTYDPVKNEAGVDERRKPLYRGFSWTQNCVTAMADIPSTAVIMMLATISYWIIQIPAFIYVKQNDEADSEHPYALVGFIVAALAFCVYCGQQYFSARREEEDRRRQEAVTRDQWKKKVSTRIVRSDFQRFIFDKHDVNHDKVLTLREFGQAMSDMGLQLQRRDLQRYFTSVDKSGDGQVSFEEFVAACNMWAHETGQQRHQALKTLDKERVDILYKEDTKEQTASTSVNSSAATATTSASVSLSVTPATEETKTPLLDAANKKKDDDCEEADEEEDEFWDHTEGQLISHAVFLLVVGTAVVAIFSDPMVDVINELGNKMSISPFYISFIVTPIGSNASEIISGLIFAKKKTNEGISLMFASLHGAATMNHTLALSIFMALVYFRGLAWRFSAEVITVVVICIVVGVNGLRRNVFMWQAVIVGAMYPFAIFLVWSLEQMGLTN